MTSTRSQSKILLKPPILARTIYQCRALAILEAAVLLSLATMEESARQRRTWRIYPNIPFAGREKTHPSEFAQIPTFNHPRSQTVILKTVRSLLILIFKVERVKWESSSGWRILSSLLSKAVTVSTNRSRLIHLFDQPAVAIHRK
jgi:hypothetical protein